MYRAATTLAACVLVATAALGNRSLTDSETAAPAAKRPASVIPMPATDDSAQLEEQILLLRNSVKNLTDSLALANSEAESAKRETENLRINLEALGAKGQGADTRVVEALRTQRAAEQQSEAARTQLVRLAEAVQVLLATSKDLDPDIRESVETEIRRTSDVLGEADATEVTATEATLSDALIVETKDDLSLVILNVGERHGVRPKMPFLVLRGDMIIGTVVVIDVRDRIAGAIVQNLKNEFIKIKKGDRAKVDAKK